MDHHILSKNVDSAKWLKEMRIEAAATNAKYAKAIGIPQSAAITCVKPSGTVSQLVNAASGIHARHSEYYIRTVRGDKKDPLAQFMVEMGFPHEECFMKPEHQWVFSFPVKSPENAVPCMLSTLLRISINNVCMFIY